VKRLLICACIALAGCTASYQTQSLSGTGSISTTGMKTSSKVYVSIPADGSYGSKVYGGSGLMTAQEVAAAFANRGVPVFMGVRPEDREGALASARTSGAQYALIPTITHWEPRATEWSGRPSRMSVSLALFDVSSGTMLSNTALIGRSRIMSFTSTSPESLLHDPLEGYVNQLYPR
jgi:hypothetical protein